MARATRAAWQTLSGSPRIMAEHKHMQNLIKDGSFPQVSEMVFVQDQVYVWQFKLRNFDNDQPGGAQLNSDLQTRKQRYGQDYILMEIRFPDDYPTKPFFLRVVKPRMVMYTGHVTAGGSICIESLTLSGRPSGWQSYYSVETVLLEVLSNMIDSPVVYIETPTGPGGLTGPLRVDFNQGLREYGLEEAKSAFARTEANHRAVGWGKSIALAPPTEPDVGETSQHVDGMVGKCKREPLKLEDAAQQSRKALVDAAQALGFVEPPDHWSICSVTANGKTKFSDLPVMLYFLDVNKDDVLELECNGMTKEQAVKALQEARGDLAQAVDTWLVKCGRLQGVNARASNSATTSVPVASSSTTAAAALLRLGLAPSEADFLQQMFCGNMELAEEWVKSVGLPAAQKEIAQNEQLVKQKMQDEIKTVLNGFEAQGGIKANRVQKIERVQNLSLWTRYQSKKASLQLTELHIFHGTSRDAVTAITNTGFEMRFSNYQQRMYFAQSSSYSHTYSQSKSAIAGCADTSHIRPAFLDGHLVMLLCKVVGGCPQGGIFTIDHNDHAYPAYIIHYK